MSSLPMAMVRLPRGEEAVLLLMLDESGALVGFEPFTGSLYETAPEDVLHLVSDQPAAVCPFVTTDYAARRQYLQANPAKMRLRAVGHRFSRLPKDFVSGFPIAEGTIRKHRAELPSEKTILLSMLFALSTVQVQIHEAEKAFKCFAGQYLPSGVMPPLEEIRRCFLTAGTQNSKATSFKSAEPYARTIANVMMSGLKDRQLRAELALRTVLPKGLSLAKLSFTLALLGQDCICLDARILQRMFPKPENRQRFEKSIGKNARGLVSEAALELYERAEDVFVVGNDYYDARDPLGRARCQWMSWEASGKPGQKSATHSVWLSVVA